MNNDTNATDDNEERNFIEAKIIIQEFIDDPTVFVVGTAPFGKLWFDHDKINQQYDTLSESWEEEYGEKEATQCKKPRIISVLLDESDPMFNKYRDNIRDAQEKKQQYQRAINAKKELELKMSSTSHVQEDGYDPVSLDQVSATPINDTTVSPAKKTIAKRTVTKKKKKTEAPETIDTTESTDKEPITVTEKPEKKVRRTKKSAAKSTTKTDENSEEK